MTKRSNPFDLVSPKIHTIWRFKYGPYLMCWGSEEYYIFVENGIIGTFHPSGDKLARAHKETGQIVYCDIKNKNKPLTESQYLLTLHQEDEQNA